MKRMSLLQQRLIHEVKNLQSKYHCEFYSDIYEKETKYKFPFIIHYKIVIEFNHYTIPLQIIFYIPNSYPFQMPHVYIRFKPEDYIHKLNELCVEMDLNEDIQKYIHSYLFEMNSEMVFHNYIKSILLNEKEKEKENQKIIEWRNSYQLYFGLGYTHRMSIENLINRIKEFLDMRFL